MLGAPGKKKGPAQAVGKGGQKEGKLAGTKGDLIGLAQAAVPLLNTDPDREGQGRAKIVEALVRGGELKRARVLAESIADFRRGVCMGQISVEAARKGDSTLAEECLELAVQSRDAENGWRRERISAYVSIATAEAGKFEEAFEQLKSITEPDDIVRTRAGFARAYARVNQLDQAGAQVSEAKGGFSISTAPMQAEAFLEIGLARERAKDETGAISSAREVVEATKEVGWLKIETARRAAELLYRMDKKDEALEQLENCRKIAMEISDRAEFKGRVISGLAQSYAACGDKKSAEKLLAEGERAADTLEPIFRCEPLAQIGAAWVKLGNLEKAHGIWMRAATIANTHKNPRVKGMGYIDVCVAAYETGKGLPKEIRALVEVR